MAYFSHVVPLAKHESNIFTEPALVFDALPPSFRGENFH